MPRTIIITGAGSGSRMGNAVPKQFLPLAGRPLLAHTLLRFYHFDPEAALILILPQAHINTWHSLCRNRGITVPHQIVAGGATRGQSIRNGLAALTDIAGSAKHFVAVHDAVRPFLSNSLLERCFREAALFGNAVPVVPLRDSIRQVAGEQNTSAERNGFRLVQTPQIFELSQLRKAYSAAFFFEGTDDATLVEKAGYPVHLTEGEENNIKITFPSDFVLGEYLLKTGVD